MRNRQEFLITRINPFISYLRTYGFVGTMQKVMAVLKMSIPFFVLRRRTNRGVGAYYDLITDDGRMFYGDNFHFGLFGDGVETFEDALDAHTDIVSEMACLNGKGRVLDIGCGICAPAVRIAGRYGSYITGINISREQVRHAKDLINEKGLSGRIDVRCGNALELDFDDSAFDSVLCIEVAGDICVTEKQKEQLVGEIHRVLRPGGYVGFSDLVFTGRPSREEEKSMRAILYHEGRELITDWPSIFRSRGFIVRQQKDYIKDTMKTWEHTLAVYKERSDEVERRYGRNIVAATMKHLQCIPAIMQKYGSFIVMSLQKP